MDFWLLSALSVFDKFLIPPFIQNASEMFQTKFNLSLQESGTVIAFPDIVFIFTGAFLGFFVDKRGKRGFVLGIGFLMLLASHFIFY